MVLFGCKEEGRESCLARKTFWEMKTAVTSGCTGIEQKFPSAHEGLRLETEHFFVSIRHYPKHFCVSISFHCGVFCSVFNQELHKNTSYLYDCQELNDIQPHSEILASFRFSMS